jgi:hypothetical protein
LEPVGWIEKQYDSNQWLDKSMMVGTSWSVVRRRMVRTCWLDVRWFEQAGGLEAGWLEPVGWVEAVWLEQAGWLEAGWLEPVGWVEAGWLEPAGWV